MQILHCCFVQLYQIATRPIDCKFIECLAVLFQQELEDYAPLPDDLVGSAKRWQEWMELERPEDEPLPGDWKRMPEFERLLIFRTLRPDRLTAAMQRFVANTIGKEYTASQPYDLERSFQVSSFSPLGWPTLSTPYCHTLLQRRPQQIR